MNRTVLITLGMLVACDGDGAYGGPGGPATKFCQSQQAQHGGDGGASVAAFCKQCCIQEVPYDGRIEKGMCVCRR